ncbi:MAG: CDP-glucose 4,6-dehydratase [Opitutales bacterium]|nr:CDP-glucose 4,6-dehydratase [Opitutales bacterium]
MDFHFFKDRRVLITGHSGFKGCWLYTWLKNLGANVCGYSLKPNTTPSMFAAIYGQGDSNSVFADILDEKTLDRTFNKFKPEIVFHLAAQPLVRLSYREPLCTYKTNVIGTLNVLQSALNCGSVKALVNITTDKCYENAEKGLPFTESEPMGGYDMYSSSKACSEILSTSFRRSFLDNGYFLATARAGNVIGGGDWAKDRLLPDCIRAFVEAKPVEIRSPDSVRPWQHVLEPLHGYMELAKKLYEFGNKYASAYNFGPEPDGILKVGDVVSLARQYFGKGSVVIKKRDTLHEAALLRLDITKAKTELDWRPVFTPQQAVKFAVDWYKDFYSGKDALAITSNQIKEFQRKILL